MLATKESQDTATRSLRIANTEDCDRSASASIGDSSAPIGFSRVALEIESLSNSEVPQLSCSKNSPLLSPGNHHTLDPLNTHTLRSPRRKMSDTPGLKLPSSSGVLELDWPSPQMSLSLGQHSAWSPNDAILPSARGNPDSFTPLSLACVHDITSENDFKVRMTGPECCIGKYCYSARSADITTSGSIAVPQEMDKQACSTSAFDSSLFDACLYGNFDNSDDIHMASATSRDLPVTNASSQAKSETERLAMIERSTFGATSLIPIPTPTEVEVEELDNDCFRNETPVSEVHRKLRNPEHLKRKHPQTRTTASEDFYKLPNVLSDDNSIRPRSSTWFQDGPERKKQRISLHLVNSQTQPYGPIHSNFSPSSSNVSCLTSIQHANGTVEDGKFCLSPALLGTRSTPVISTDQDALPENYVSRPISCPSETENWYTKKLMQSEQSSPLGREAFGTSQSIHLDVEEQDNSSRIEYESALEIFQAGSDKQEEKENEIPEKSEEVVKEDKGTSSQSVKDVSMENDESRSSAVTSEKAPIRRGYNGRTKGPLSCKKPINKSTSKSQYAVGSNQYRKRCKVNTNSESVAEGCHTTTKHRNDKLIVFQESGSDLPVFDKTDIECLQRDTRNWNKKKLQPIGFYKDSAETGSSVSAMSDSDDEAAVGLAPSATQKWTDEETKLLSSLKEKGMPWSLIASALGRSERACQLKHNHLFGSHNVSKSGRNHKGRSVKQTRDRRPFFDKNPEKVDLLMRLYHSRKKDFWQEIAREVGCNSNLVESKVLNVLSSTTYDENAA